MALNRLPRIAAVSAAVAFVLAATILLSARNHFLLVFVAVIPAFAGIGILRRRVWSAYGFALFELAQSTLLPLALLGSTSLDRQLIVSLAFGITAAILFFFAGRALAAIGAQPGWAAPWVLVSCLFTLPFFFMRAYTVPTASMEDSVLLGDHVLVRTFPPVSPKRGDILTFHYPADHQQVFIKRVIGVPGDRIRIQNGVVYLNGKTLAERYAVHKLKLAEDFPDKAENLPRSIGPAAVLLGSAMLRNNQQRGEIVVPPNKYFVLGDNRDNSLDSRYWGFLSPSEIIGRAFLIYDSEGPNHQIRWNRLLKLVSGY